MNGIAEAATELTDQELDIVAKRVLSGRQFEQSSEGESIENALNGVITDEYGLPFEPEGYYNAELHFNLKKWRRFCGYSQITFIMRLPVTTDIPQHI